MAREKLVLLDGSSLLYRAFFALPPLSTAAGTPTNAVFGFTSMLLKVLEEEKPDRLIIAFEGGRTFRHREFTEYKAHRPPTPDDLACQFDLARAVAEAFRIPVVHHDGFEADDVIGTLSLMGEERDQDVVIVTGDLDALQLVSGRTAVVVNRKGVSDTQRYDPTAVEARFGLPAARLPEFKALKGDPSDNIPGIPGVGDKTATSLLQQYGSLDGVLEHAGEVKAARVRAGLMEGREQAQLYRKLATIVRDLPLEAEWPAEPWRGPDPERVRPLFQKLEFQSLLRRVATGGSEVGEAPPPPLEPERPWRLVEDGPELAAWCRRAAESDLVAIRTHQVGKGNRHAALQAIALATGEGAVVVCAPAEEGAEGTGEGLFAGLADPWVLPESVQTLITAQGRRLAGFDWKSDLHALAAAGVTIPEGTCAEDAQLAAYVLNPGRAGYSVERLAAEFLERSLPPGAPGEPARLAHEAATLVELAPRLRERLAGDQLLKVYEELELPLVPILYRMEALGVAVHRGELQALAQRLSQRMRELEAQAHGLAGQPFNLGSPKQLQQILFDHLGLPRGRKTQTGYSTDSDVLQDLVESHGSEIAAALLRWREVSRLKSTYADAIPALLDPRDGRIHTRLNQAVAATGRLSSSEPNLQNIPIRTEEGREVRAAFIPAPGLLLLSADYSQIELRIMAHLSQDAALIRAFQEDRDIHAATASRIFGAPPTEVTPDQRRSAKTVNFAVLYGQKEFGLSRQLRISLPEAKALIESYFRQFPGVLQYVESTLAQARSTGYVTTLPPYLRRRYLPAIHAGNRNERLAAEREAMNAPVQGAAADIIKVAMIRVEAALRRARLAARMILQVHDELLFETPPEEADRLADLIREEMEGAAQLAAPLRVELKRGRNWRDLT